MFIFFSFIIINVKIAHIEAGHVDEKLEQVVDSCVPGEFRDACDSCNFPQKPVLGPKPKGVDDAKVT